MKLVSNQHIPPKPARTTADADKTADQLRAEGEALLRHADALEKWSRERKFYNGENIINPIRIDRELRRREAILALLDAPKRALFEAEAKGDYLELLDLIGLSIYGINVNGTAEQLAELINRGYQGIDYFLRSVEDALAIARGEETAAKAQREVREVEQRRDFLAAIATGITDEELDRLWNEPDDTVVRLPDGRKVLRKYYDPGLHGPATE